MSTITNIAGSDIVKNSRTVINANFTALNNGKAESLETTNTVTFSATPNFDLSLGNFQKIVLTGDVTSSTITNLHAGQKITFFIFQNGAGGHTFVWPTDVHGGITIGSDANKCNIQKFECPGGTTTLYATSTGVINA